MTSGDGAIYKNGIRYVPVKTAAKAVDLVPDYVSRMCREGLVRGIRIAGVWYVNESSLKEFIDEHRVPYSGLREEDPTSCRLHSLRYRPLLRACRKNVQGARCRRSQ